MRGVRARETPVCYHYYRQYQDNSLSWLHVNGWKFSLKKGEEGEWREAFQSPSSLPSPLLRCRKHLQCVRGHLSSTAYSLFTGYPLCVCFFVFVQGIRETSESASKTKLARNFHAACRHRGRVVMNNWPDSSVSLCMYQRTSSYPKWHILLSRHEIKPRQWECRTLQVGDRVCEPDRQIWGTGDFAE